MTAIKIKANSLVLSLSTLILISCGGGTSTDQPAEPEIGAANSGIEVVSTGSGDDIIGAGATGFTNTVIASSVDVETGTDAEVPTVTAEPEIEATEPVVVVAEPDIEVTEPDIEVTEPEIEVTEPEVEVIEPEIEVVEPVVAVIEPTAEVDQPQESETAEIIKNIPETRVNTIGTNVGDVVKILDQLPVSTAQLSVQMTPIDNQHGYLYVANIEHGPNGDTNDTQLRTILRQGIQVADGSWEWKSALIEDRTIHDAWHTAPGIAVDREGTVHIAYNMHNTPWQYKRSTNAHDISDFTFHGQFISQEEIDRLKFENKTYFPTFGTAEIPGNQVSYPRFAKNNKGELYITYRFAAKPNQNFENRMMSSGLSKYDYQTKAWNSIGVPVPVESADYVADPNAPENAVVMAGEQGWTSYLARIGFGPEDDLHFTMYWRQGKAGANMTQPCHIYSRDEITFSDISGQDLILPISTQECGNIGYPDSKEFYSVGTTVINAEGNPHFVTTPYNETRDIVSYDKNQNKWINEESPHNAVEIFFDHEDNMWALATGLKVLKKNKGESQWSTVYQSNSPDDCYPRASLNEDKSIAYVHTHSCDAKSFSVYGIRLR